MPIYIYKGCYGLVKFSGVGEAIKHEEEGLKRVGVKMEGRLTKETDVVILNTVFPDSFLLAILCKIMKKKIVYYAHSSREDFKNSFKFSNLLAPLFKRWMYLCYRLGDIIITPTEYAKKMLKEDGLNKKIYVLSNGVDTSKFKKAESNVIRRKYGVKKTEVLVISVGHLIERKGIIEFINVARHFKSYKFIWFGNTKKYLMERKVKKAIKTAPDNIIFAGKVSQDTLAAAYNEADIFLFLSKEETEGIVVLEALSSQTLTILNDIPVYDSFLYGGLNVLKAHGENSAINILKNIHLLNTGKIKEKGLFVARERDLSIIGEKLKEILRENFPDCI